MSNVYNANPIYLDSTMAATAKNTAGTPWGAGFRFLIKAIKWDVQAGGVGKAVVLKDGLGNIIFSDSTTAPAIPDPVFFGQPFYVADFQLTTISAGVLYIYLA